MPSNKAPRPNRAPMTRAAKNHEFRPGNCISRAINKALPAGKLKPHAAVATTSMKMAKPREPGSMRAISARPSEVAKRQPERCEESRCDSSPRDKKRCGGDGAPPSRSSRVLRATAAASPAAKSGDEGERGAGGLRDDNQVSRAAIHEVRIERRVQFREAVDADGKWRPVD